MKAAAVAAVLLFAGLAIAEGAMEKEALKSTGRKILQLENIFPTDAEFVDTPPSALSAYPPATAPDTLLVPLPPPTPTDTTPAVPDTYPPPAATTPAPPGPDTFNQVTNTLTGLASLATTIGGLAALFGR